ncbi:uncharacterized protein [Parasteatoda tepidariorum]|uniref:uncharacterized protein n=1 Tax=Parasteatoda tepidariorum TaxID=114398 RepID=UPI00077FC4CE|nr:uncharacterized protein LOC107442581 [Parasteatoda tepidariorum]
MIRAELFLLFAITLFAMVVGHSGIGKPIRTPAPDEGIGPDCGEHKHGETFQTKDPCMEQTCNAGMLFLSGCPDFALPKDSKCRRGTGEGTYPHCCEHPVCPGDPEF